MDIIKNLPIELQDIILNLYWMDVFGKVIKKLNNYKTDIDKIYIYMCNHGIHNINQGPRNPTMIHHLSYFRKHNNIIRSLFKNNCRTHLLCEIMNIKRSTLNIYVSSNLLDHIEEEYKYIAFFYLIFSPLETRCNGYVIINYFKNIHVIRK
jgi:hypothetical protein